MAHWPGFVKLFLVIGIRMSYLMDIPGGQAVKIMIAADRGRGIGGSATTKHHQSQAHF